MEDHSRLMEIYRYAQDFMIQSGNPTQWGHSYPDPEIIKEDILAGRSLLIIEGEEIHGVFVLLEGTEPTYQRIDHGAWLNNEPYVTIHRIAGDGQIHGIFRFAADYCKGLSSNVRIDTHSDNIIMQKLIEQNGFQKCGIVYVRDGLPRIAYHWTEK